MSSTDVTEELKVALKEVVDVVDWSQTGTGRLLGLASPSPGLAI